MQTLGHPPIQLKKERIFCSCENFSPIISFPTPPEANKCSEFRAYSLVFLYSFIINIYICKQYLVLFCLF